MKCEYCNNDHDGSYGSGRFCSSKCARGFSTKEKRKEISEKVSKKLGGIGASCKHTKKRECLNCKKITYNSKFCSLKCFRDFKWEQYCAKVEKHNGFPWCDDRTNPRAKKYLILKRGHKCEICGNTEWMGKPIPLVLDHVNGKANNWTLNNLRLVCGNCDMQLPTYKGKNKGNATRKFNVRLSK